MSSTRVCSWVGQLVSVRLWLWCIAMCEVWSPKPLVVLWQVLWVVGFGFWPPGTLTYHSRAALGPGT